MTKELKVK